VRIFADNRRYSKYAAICVGAGLLGVLVGRASWWAGGPIVVCFFGAAAFLIGRAVSQAPRITIGEDGLGGAALPRQLAWDEIATIAHTTRTARYRTLHLLRIRPHDEQVLELSLMDLLTPPETIVAAVEEFHEVT
jgi:hypothetical protein